MTCGSRSLVNMPISEGAIHFTSGILEVISCLITPKRVFPAPFQVITESER